LGPFCPTFWQRQTLPTIIKDRVSVIFDGMVTDLVHPDPTARFTVGKADATSWTLFKVAHGIRTQIEAKKLHDA
jgi:hypothetical protein